MAADSSRSEQLKRQLDAALREIERLRAELECAKEEKRKLSDRLQEEEDEVYLLQASLKKVKAKYQAELRYQGQLLELVESSGVQFMMERDELEKQKKALEEEVRNKHLFISASGK
jgi:chromosome segregation ATPase